MQVEKQQQQQQQITQMNTSNVLIGQRRRRKKAHNEIAELHIVWKAFVVEEAIARQVETGHELDCAVVVDLDRIVFLVDELLIFAIVFTTTAAASC